MSAFTERFGHRMKDTVTVEPRTGTDTDRVESYGAALDLPIGSSGGNAYVDRQTRMTRDASGREVVRSAVVFVDEIPIVEVTARVTLDGNRVRLLNVKRFTQLIPHQEMEIA